MILMIYQGMSGWERKVKKRIMISLMIQNYDKNNLSEREIENYFMFDKKLIFLNSDVFTSIFELYRLFSLYYENFNQLINKFFIYFDLESSMMIILNTNRKKIIQYLNNNKHSIK